MCMRRLVLGSSSSLILSFHFSHCELVLPPLIHLLIIKRIVISMEFSARLRSCSDFVRSLEEERKKIQVFERELPLCLQIVTHAIESLKQEIESDAASDDGPVLEFIPLRPSSSCLSEGRRDDGAAQIQSDEKPDWLSTVQLWNQVDADVDPAAKELALARPVAVRAKRAEGAFPPFEGERLAAEPPAVATASFLTTTGGVDVGGGGEEKEGPSEPTNRKVRRCWSPELHSRFLQALEQLGGSRAATPKQIRQVMKVDGLTNDEIKSHLQKYRLHSRRPGAAVQITADDDLTSATQFVVVGGIWVPPVDYSAAVAAATATGKAASLISRAFTPGASLPSDRPGLQRQQPQSKLNQSHSSPIGRCSRENYSNSSSYSRTIN